MVKAPKTDFEKTVERNKYIKFIFVPEVFLQQ